MSKERILVANNFGLANGVGGVTYDGKVYSPFGIIVYCRVVYKLIFYCHKVKHIYIRSKFSR